MHLSFQQDSSLALVCFTRVNQASVFRYFRLFERYYDSAIENQLFNLVSSLAASSCPLLAVVSLSVTGQLVQVCTCLIAVYITTILLTLWTILLQNTKCTNEIASCALCRVTQGISESPAAQFLYFIDSSAIQFVFLAFILVLRIV